MKPIKLKQETIRRILVRGTNWVGDAVMTLPALAAVKENFPTAAITVLARPWVAPVYASHPAVSEVIVLDRKGRHKGVGGIWRAARELRNKNFDLAVLFQNAFEAALLAWLAGVPRRLGYNTDGRGILLNWPVPIERGDKQVHETHYYLRILAKAGLDATWALPVFHLSEDAGRLAEQRLRATKVDGFLVGLAPGAAYGSAKQWPAERFAAAADMILDRTGGAALVFGSPSEATVAAKTVAAMTHPAVDLSGKTDLEEAAALISRCNMFITNDSGLMHVASAVGTPLVAIFGSTNPLTTSPAGGAFKMVRRPVDCSPCMKTVCPKPEHRCMEMIKPTDVAEAGLRLIEEIGRKAHND